MSFDVEQLDSFLLVGSAVTLLAILAVRLSSRAGLPRRSRSPTSRK